MQRSFRAFLLIAGTLAGLGFTAVAQTLDRPSLSAARAENERTVALRLAEAIYRQRCADAYWYRSEPPCFWPPVEFGGRIVIALQGGQAWLYSAARSSCSRFESTWDGIVRLRSTNACKVDNPKDALKAMIGKEGLSTGQSDPFKNPITFPIVIDQFDSSAIKPLPYVEEVRAKGMKSPNVELGAAQEYQRMYPACRAKGKYPAVLDSSDRIYVIIDGTGGCPTVALLLQNDGVGSVSMPHIIVGPKDVQYIRDLVVRLRTISFEIK